MMPYDPHVGGDEQQPVRRLDGVTVAERYLKNLCERSFLRLWSYAGLFRDQKFGEGNSEGKEVADLLVVFENHIILFSDKDITFPSACNISVDWGRWYRKAVESGAKQTWGAERWIREYPNRLFLDHACSHPFPIPLPDPTHAVVHRIVVAHGASQRCKQEFGGSGSLMIVPSICGKEHYDPRATDRIQPFAIGQVDPKKGYVHVLDDTTLDIVLGTLDTVSDFVAYLTKKEGFIASGRLMAAAGEEELLAVYLSNLNEQGEHDFVFPPKVSCVSVSEGHWVRYLQSPQRHAQIAADKVSYFWDALTETFIGHVLEGTYQHTTHPEVADQERMMRFFAREPRTRRRLLAESFFKLIEKAKGLWRAARVVEPSGPGDPYFVFLVLEPREDRSYEEYRQVRSEMLLGYCMALKVKRPDATDIIGIAIDPPGGRGGSEDIVYYDARTWGPEQQVEGEDLIERGGILQNTEEFRDTVWEYPVDDQPPRLSGLRSIIPYVAPPKAGRNERCPCGSGQKYKRCCGR